MEKEYTILNEHFGEMNSNATMADKLIRGLDERQQASLENLPNYGKVTTVIALVILTLGIGIQALTGTLPNEQIQLVKALQRPSIGGVLSFALTLIAHIINAVFAIWATSFIPYFALKSYKASQKIKIPLRTNVSKWIQLFAAVFLPVFAFAIFASNFPGSNAHFIVNLNLNDALLIISGTLIVWIVLYTTVKFIPLKLVVIHLTIYSMLLYSVIFCAYILGFGTITYAAVLGMMFFLMFSSNKLGEVARRISIYDIDSTIADKVSAVSNRENTIKVKEAEADVSKLDQELGNRVEKLNSEEDVNKRLQQIKSTRLEFNSKVGKTKLEILNKKLDFYNQLFSSLSEEYDLKVTDELPTLLKDFKTNVKNMSPQQLSETMDDIINRVNISLDTIPKGLDNLRVEMKKATKELQEATEELNRE